MSHVVETVREKCTESNILGMRGSLGFAGPRRFKDVISKQASKDLSHPFNISVKRMQEQERTGANLGFCANVSSDGVV